MEQKNKIRKAAKKAADILYPVRCPLCGQIPWGKDPHGRTCDRCAAGLVYTGENYCMKCGKSYDFAYMKNAKGVPKCTCGGMIKPDVVLYEESLDQTVIEGAVRAIADAEVLIVGGTSLTVYPAAGLIRYYRGNKLVLINRDETPYDTYANLIFRDPIGKVLGAI